MQRGFNSSVRAVGQLPVESASTVYAERLNASVNQYVV